MDCVPIVSVASTLEWGEGNCCLLTCFLAMMSCVKVLTLSLSTTERVLDKADHENLLFVLLKKSSAMKCLVGVFLTILTL